jgi:ppGpp synthetase/RelA/SpoT-type nucleotidyltranferase
MTSGILLEVEWIVGRLGEYDVGCILAVHLIDQDKQRFKDLESVSNKLLKRNNKHSLQHFNDLQDAI